MKHFSVLLVDDERKEILEPAEEEFPKEVLGLREDECPDKPRIRLLTAANRKDAEELLKKEFFHLALVDPRLTENQFDGFFVLKNLKELRPACTRFLLTQLSRDSFDGANSVVFHSHPDEGIAQGILVKSDHDNPWRDLIRKRAESWLKNSLKVEGTSVVAQRLNDLYRIRNRKLDVDITDDEIDYLVSRVFGQGESWHVGKQGSGMNTVTLQPLQRQGLSPAVVAFASGSSSNNNVQGIQCVLKFAHRHYVEKELANYCQYVRYRLGLHHRVELLGWALADNFGVLCYNFASDTTLYDLFFDDFALFEEVLNNLFSSEKKAWYKDTGKTKLAEYFKSCFKFDNEKRDQTLREMKQDTLSIENLLHKDHRNACDAIRATVVALANEVFSMTIFTNDLTGCIVHGDLHGDNVLVCDDEPRLIDYHTVATGPRTVDFATLEAGVRLLALKRRNNGKKIDIDPRPDEIVLPEIVDCGDADVLVWNAVWGGGAMPVPNPSAAPPWERAAYRLGNLARQNSTHPDLSEREYAATCLLWCVRLYSHSTLTLRDRARLIVWMSHLVRVLNTGQGSKPIATEKPVT